MLPTLQTIAKIQKKQSRQTQSGKNITSLSLSVGEKNTKGEYDNLYFDATFWEKSADFVNNNFNEGDFIGIKGDLITTHYAKEDGTKIYKTEVKFPKAYFIPRNKSEGEYRPSPQATQTSPQPQYNTNGEASSGTPVPEIDVNEDEIPFGYIGLSEGKHFIHMI